MLDLASPGDPVVLVPNQVSLGLYLARHHRDLGQPDAFPAPPVHTLSQWLAERLERACLLTGLPGMAAPGRFVLRGLWEAAVAEETADWLPTEQSAFAVQAMAVERLLQHWTRGPPENVGGRAWARFLRCRETVQAALAQNGWGTAEQQMRAFLALLAESKFPREVLPPAVHLCGFSELTGLEQALLKGLEDRGVVVVHELPPGMDVANAPRPDIQACPDLPSELRFAARFAARRLEQGDASIAIVANELNTIARPLHRAFEAEFHADWMLGMASPEAGVYCIHSASPLSDHPLVRAALDLLDLGLGGLRRRHAFADISRLLLNPAWSGARRERSARAVIEHRLREQGAFRQSLAGVVALAGDHAAPVLREVITRLPDASRLPRGPGGLRALLEHWGWPGPLPRDRAAESAASRFAGLLARLERLGASSHEQALALLRRMCAEPVADPPGGALSPVQVLTPEDAYGFTFDAVLAVNFHAGNWPLAPAPNPLLPARINRNIPRATAPGQLEYARRLQAGLWRAAPVLELSLSRYHDGAPRLPSPLWQPAAINDLETGAGESLALELFPDCAVLSGLDGHPWMRARDSHKAPAVDDAWRPGGLVGLLETQAACPFAAFLKYRLDARFEPMPRAFAGPDFTGTLVHRALERLYRPGLDSGRTPQAGAVPDAVAEALEHCQAKRRLAPVALAAERERLERLLEAWLAVGPDDGQSVPLRLEAPLETRWGGLEISLRVDRIDRLPDGRLLIIDYKTGKLQTPAWASDRLDQPQLPLYAVLLSRAGADEVAGVALAQVRAGDFALLGLGDAGLTQYLPGFKQPRVLNKAFGTWAQALESWEGALESLLAEFRQGDCRNLIHDRKPLRYLGLEPILREPALEAWRLRGTGGASGA